MFKVRPFEAKTLSWWNDERENIDLNPPYQRRSGIWSTKDRTYLIDSILNDYDIPKIYIADFTYVDTPLNKKKKSYAVIDGKQRFEAIFAFFDGKIVLDQDFKLSEDSTLKLGGLGYKDLKSQYPKVASKFDNFNLSVVSVITDEEDKINELFVRLNRSKPLTGAEIRGAMSGQIPGLIERLAHHVFFESKIKFSVKRKQDHNVAAKLLLIEFRGKFVDTKRVHLNRFVEEGVRSETTDFERAAERTNLILDYMKDAFLDRDYLLRNSGPVTTYYWLFRNYGKNYSSKIREFLVNFESDRIKNRKVERYETSQPQEPDKELFDYDISIRSANDQGSMTRCYNILEKRFKQFVNL
jgi:hypothetical protein